MTIKRVLGLLVLVMVMAVTGPTNSSAAADGVRTVYRTQCDGQSSISIKISVYEHPFDFERGGSIGYGVFYNTSENREIALYNNGVLTHDAHGSTPAWYVGWQYDGTKYTGPMRTCDFAPLPPPSDTRRVRVFELPQRAYNRSAPFQEREDYPPFMNIFLDPGNFPERYFSIVADCLAAHRDGINHALAALGPEFPRQDRRFYEPLRLGGIVLGLPPYDDKEYLELIRAIWGDTQNEKAIPPYGRFTLGLGQSAKGIIAGRSVEIAVDGAGEIKLRVDDKVISSGYGETNDTEVIHHATGWWIGEGVCHDDLQRCGKGISLNNRNDDRSLTFVVVIKNGPRSYSDRPGTPPME
jgi:hypothetical protein